jgi:hypothetical protein
MSCRKRRRSDKRDAPGRHEARPNADDLKAVRAGVGAALQALYSVVPHEEVPDRIAEPLRRLDQQRDTSA